MTTKEAAIELGVTQSRIRALIASGRLKAVKHGRDWLIESRHLAPVRVRKTGRPTAVSV